MICQLDGYCGFIAGDSVKFSNKSMVFLYVALYNVNFEVY